MEKTLTEKEQLLEKDFKYIWHPFTQMKEAKENPPMIIERGEGIYIWDIDGNKYIDAVSSWWVNTLGHSNKRLNKALFEQAQTLEHVIFAGFTHKNAITLAEKLVELTCPRLTKVFYSDNGSTAVEVALKMAYQYFAQSGQPQKSKFIAFKDSYHGDTLGAVSVGGVDIYHKIYKPLLFEIFQAQNPACYRCPAGCDKQSCQCECAESVEDILKEHHSEIAGIIIEPLVQGAGGMIMHPPKYLVKLRELCDKYEVLLILDEVAVGFGRTGKMFAYEHAGIEPDIMCIAKGITAGYTPLSVTMASDEIYNAFYDDYETNKTFYHGHSYTANPLATRIAVENLKIFEEENILEQIRKKAAVLNEELEKLKSLKNVGDVRTTGMIGAIELVKNKETKEPFSFDEHMGARIYEEALKMGAILRPLGNIIYFMPAYVITEDEIKTLVNIAYKAIKNTLG